MVRSEILVMLGENGTGKTTFIRMLHGSLKPDEEGVDLPEFRVSYKPQKISPKFPGSVRARRPARGAALNPNPRARGVLPGERGRGCAEHADGPQPHQGAAGAVDT